MGEKYQFVVITKGYQQVYSDEDWDGFQLDLHGFLSAF